jgi:flagellar biosynthesis protein FlhB
MSFRIRTVKQEIKQEVKQEVKQEIKPEIKPDVKYSKETIIYDQQTGKWKLIKE